MPEKSETKATENNRVKKGKKGIFSIIFGRLFIFALMILAQFFIYFSMMINLSEFQSIYYLLRVLAFLLVIYIINEQNTDPTMKLIWAVNILVFPIFGSLLYLYVKFDVGSRKLKKKIQDTDEITGVYLASNSKVYDKMQIESPYTSGICKYLYNYGGFPTYENTSTIYLKDGQEKFDLLLEDLKQAKNFIFIEYFIIEKGYMWDSILEVLNDKVKEGVEVRVMYDGMCSLIQLPVGYFKKLEKIGIKSKAFAPMRPFITTKQNNRDHRKIVVIDGLVAYTGGINLADEYMNLKERFGYWKDSSLRIEGDCVQNFTTMFLRMWNLSNKNIEQFNKYLDVEVPIIENAEGFAVGFADNPFNDENIGESVYLHILNSAQKYVHISTPYLVLDNVMMDALKFASKRGVEVVLILPGIPDKAYAYCVARTYYEELIEAGVKIYEYTPGFNHAKLFVSDDNVATVGSINLDYRSLYLHFECGAMIINSETVNQVEQDFINMQEQSSLVTMMQCRNRSFLYKNAGMLLRLVAPLL